MRKLFVLLLVCMIPFLAFAGGNSEASANGPQTVVFWNGYTGPDRVVLEEIVNDFNTMQSEVYIDMQIMPWDSLYQKLMTAMVAGEGPDLIGMQIDRLAEYASANKLVDLTPYMENSSIGEHNLAPALFNAAQFNGKQYALPMANSTLAMYYNKDLFREAGLDPDKPPKTFDELFDAWDKLIKKDENGNVVQYAQAIAVKNTIAMIPIFMWSYGADYIDENGNVVINSPEAVECMTILQEAFANGVSPVGLTGQDADTLFAAGMAAIEFNGPWAYQKYVDSGIDTGIALIPEGPRGHYTIGGNSCLAINANSNVPEAAWKFIEYWNSIDAQKKWSMGVGFPPSRTDIPNDDPMFDSHPNTRYFMESSSFAKIYMEGQVLASRFNEEAIVPLYETVTRGTSSVKDALATAEQTMNSIIGD